MKRRDRQTPVARVRTLIVSPVPSQPTRAGWSVRTKYLVEALKEAGQKVKFAYIPQAGIPGDMAGMIRHWGRRLHVLPGVSTDKIVQRNVGLGIVNRIRYQIEYRHARARDFVMTRTGHRWDAWYTRQVQRYLQALQRERRFDAVLVQYGFFSKAFDAFDPGILRLLDTIDVMAGRKEFMHRAGLVCKWAATEPEETRHLQRADIVLAITDEDAQIFTNMSTRLVKVVGHLMPVFLVSLQSCSERKILFVGNNNKMNQQAAHFLKDDILPRLRMRVAEVHLLFAWDICSVLPRGEGYTLLGAVEDMRPVYEQSALVVNPILVGTGLAIKTIEALAHGKPVVATQMGARGLLQGAGRAFLTAEGPDEFADAVARILQSPQLAVDLAREAQHFVIEYRRQAIKRLLSCFDDLPR